MKTHIIPALLACLALSSCDKARNLADKARSAVESEMAKGSADAAESKPDPELLKLVDETPEGFHFRKDLPFPSRVDVKVTRSMEMDARSFETSVLGNTTNTVKGTQTTVTRLEKATSQVRYTLMESVFTEPVTKEAEKKEPVVRQIAPPGKPRTFQKSGKTWTSADTEGFKAAALAKQLTPVFDQLLEENGLVARSLWFGKRRIKVGDEVPVPAETLGMLLSGKVKGSFKLKLESTGAVAGHPCGIFSLSGDYNRKQFPDFEGDLTDEEVTVQSGKVWLSLLHPLVLKEELDTIQTFKRGSGDNPSSRTQGAIKVTITREWKQMGP
ncbi:MAG: hypothetical protein EOP85_06400 [Verrucomicrobiaceae bacterium]|nr:MAG: hypothetical protein EOP85_06400 [Verrucomicrobiaceae bacterium]